MSSGRGNTVFYGLLATSTALLLATLYVTFVRAPIEATMGIVQKIFYFHVPSAYAMYIGAAACFVASCVIVAITHDTVGLLTIALVWLGHVTVTGTELFESAGVWEFQSSLSDPQRLGEYQGTARMGRTLGSVWAPALYTFLAMNWGAVGWAIIAAIVLLAVVLIRPSVAAARTGPTSRRRRCRTGAR